MARRLLVDRPMVVLKHLGAAEWEPVSARSTPLLREQLLSGAISMQGGVAFLDGAIRSWTARDLFAWLEDSLVKPGWMRMPRTLREPGVPPVELDVHASWALGFEVLTQEARARVGDALIRYLAPTPDERFLHAAIHGGRVRRGLIGGRPAWVPSLREIDFLSDVVLSLFAADLLHHPDRYRQHMCVCPSCSRISFTRAQRALERHCTRCSGESRAIRVA
jgi:hypothetical protein